MKLACSLIIKEALHRKISFLLAIVAVTAAVGLCVAAVMTQQAARNETRRTTRDIGSNVYIIPRQTDILDYHNTGFSHHTMSEEAVHRMATAANISYNHLIATLTQEITVADRNVRLVGVSGALHPPGRAQKSKMGFSINPGEIYVGHRVAPLLGAEKNKTVQLLGRPFTVARIQPEKGTAEDITIYASLSDVQQALSLEGQINEINAIDCLCLTADKDPVEILRAELEQLLPEAQVYHRAAIADARARQRQMIDRLATFSIATVLLVSAAWLGVLAAINVRERTSEIGLLRALGYRSATISLLVLGRAALIGICGAAAGYALGCGLALWFGPELFPVTAKSIQPDASFFGWSLAAAPLFVVIASFIPAAMAITEDPAVTLRAD